MLPSCDMEFSKNVHLQQAGHNNGTVVTIQYSTKKAFILAENFGACYILLDLFMNGLHSFDFAVGTMPQAKNSVKPL